MLRVCLASRYIVRCTSDSGRGRLQMKRKWVVNRLIYQLVEAGIDNLDIVVDDVASLPIHQASVSTGHLHIQSSVLYLGQSFPITLHFRCLFSPLFADDFRYFRVCKSGMLGDDLCLVMLTVKNESYKEYQFSSLSQRSFGQVIKEKRDASVMKDQ